VQTSPPDLARRLDGLLSFPVTPFDGKGQLDLETFREHVRRQVAAGPAALFVCCGTGEFFSLDLEEYAECVRAAVEEVAGALPVFSGVGYGTALARRYAAGAGEAGADGLLVLPPYLVKPPQDGLYEHYRALAESADLPLIVYQRDNAVFHPDTVVRLAEIPNVIGLKDGYGDLDLVQRIRSALRSAGEDEFLLLNGMPTAEMTAPAYLAAGVTAYSSAVFCFAPQIALGFNRAFRGGDADLTARYLDEFYRPLVELRQLGHGYAVSLVKAGVRLRGLDVGGVRPPLADPPPEHLDRLSAIIDQGLAVVASGRGEAG
jgi:5-dehydro-4-deoxyglucarate dehydratase